MNYKKIIVESWQYTQQNKKLIRWYGFLPALFTTTVAIGYLLYQFFAFKNSYLFSNENEGFLEQVLSFIWGFVKEHVSWTFPLIVILIICAIIYFLYPTLAKASAIQMIARNRNGQEAGVGTGLRYGIRAFLPLFEYHLLIKAFSFFSILIEMSFVVRNLGMGLFRIFLPIFILFLFLSLLLTLLFTFSDFYIVIDKHGIFNSMKESAKLVIGHWKHTFLITILMLLIGLRIIIQAVMVFLVPSLIVLITGYIAHVAIPSVGLIVGASAGVISLIIAAYLNGVVDIFSYSVWTFTFLELSSEKELSARDQAPEPVSAREQIVKTPESDDGGND